MNNALTPAQVERLALLIEECTEVVHIACKVLRHGYHCTSPGSVVTNLASLEHEVGDVLAAIDLLKVARDIHSAI